MNTRGLSQCGDDPFVYVNTINIFIIDIVCIMHTKIVNLFDIPLTLFAEYGKISR